MSSCAITWRHHHQMWNIFVCMFVMSVVLREISLITQNPRYNKCARCFWLKYIGRQHNHLALCLLWYSALFYQWHVFMSETKNTLISASVIVKLMSSYKTYLKLCVPLLLLLDSGLAYAQEHTEIDGKESWEGMNNCINCCVTDKRGKISPPKWWYVTLVFELQ